MGLAFMLLTWQGLEFESKRSGNSRSLPGSSVSDRGGRYSYHSDDEYATTATATTTST
jgi:hypothetical protein